MVQHFEEIVSSLLPIWDMAIPDIPSRNQLYSFEPLGLRSSLVESLISYICRLANEHHVEVGTLIHRSIAPVLGKHYIAASQSRGVSSFLRSAGPINGNGSMASEWVSALEALTLRGDLSLLTLIVGANTLSQRDLLQPVRQWCPVCYEVWRRQGAIIYEPLLWSINGITVCAQHCKLLERCCPHCSSSLPWLNWRSRPGYCSSCGRWLGKTDGKSQVEEKDIYISEIVGSFLAHIPQLSLSIPRVSVIRSLRELIEATTDGNIAAFSRNIGLPKTTVWELVQGRFPPSLSFLLQLCYQFRLPLLQILIDDEHISLRESPVAQEHALKPGVRRPFDREKVQRALDDILADQQGVPQSMREVSLQLGHPVRTIETHFPVSCQMISCRYAEYRKQQSQNRKAALKQRITEAARIVFVQGEKLTYRRVGSIVGEPGCFREYEARMVLLNIRRQVDSQNSLE